MAKREARVGQLARLILVRDVRLGINNLRLHGMRSFLTMLGMVFGVASVIAMLAVGNGAGQEALEQIRQLGSDIIILESSKPLSEDKQRQGQNFVSMYGLTYLDAQRVQETIPALRLVVPVKVRREQVYNSSQAVDVRVVGTVPSWFNVVQRPLVAGRLLTPFDEERHMAVAVITAKLAQQLFPLQSVLGNFIRLGGNSYRVVGVVRSSAQESSKIKAADSANDVYIPLAVMRERYGDILVEMNSGSSLRERVELYQLLVKMESEADVEPNASAVQTLLQRFHKKQDVVMHIPLELLRQAQATQQRFNIVLGSIAAISLLVGGIGIMNIMLASVTERTREIGVRRAIGARQWQIITQFLIETVVLSCCGGLLGLLVGLVLPWLITQLTGLSTVVTTASLVLSLLISISVGIIFGLYPAIRASRLDPITALRHE
ncbi:MAG: ABC transporter permease [Desulfuromonas sp.]|nr:ABC transporter permease [Desulfuromonas sp.]